MTLKKLLPLLLAALLAFTFNAFANDLPKPNLTHEKGLNRIVAVVNNEVITQDDLLHAIIVAKQQFARNHVPLPSEKKFRHQVLQQLIYQKLQLQLAKANGMSISDDELQQTIENIAQQNHVTLAQLKQKLRQTGMSFKTFQQQVRKQAVISKMQHQAVGNELTATPAEIEAFRNEHQSDLAPDEYDIATILIPLSDNATQAEIRAAKTKAEHLATKLKAGASFTTAMKNHPGSSDLGWRALNDLPSMFTKPVSSLKKGEIAGPVKAPNGYHIIKLLGKRAGTSNISDDQIKDMVLQQKYQKALQKWLDSIKKTAYIRIYND